MTDPDAPGNDVTTWAATGSDVAARLRLAAAAEGPRLGTVINQGFAEDPVNHWVVPDPADWPTVLDPFFGVIAEEAAVGAGAVYVLGDDDAVAVWFDVTEPPGELPAEPPAEMAQLCGRWTANFHTLSHVLHDAEPASPPHHRLEFLVVREGMRGKGIGPRVMAAHHALLDAAGLPAYLNATNWDSYRFYLRNGYRLLDSGPVALPDGPQIWPMWRDPGSTPGISAK